MRLALLMWILWVAAAGFRCDDPHSPAPKPDPKPGDSVQLRGTLGEDVDCRLFRTDGGSTYSLNVTLRRYPNGAKLCIYGTVVEAGNCLTSPMIEVQSVRAWSSCP